MGASIEHNTKNTHEHGHYAAPATQLERQVEKRTGRAAARRNAPKVPHAIRAGPNKRREKNLGSVYLRFI